MPLLNHTRCPRVSTIIGPSCPGPSFGATKMYPGAVLCACVVTAIVGGLRSGRERKLCTFDRRSAGPLFGVFISAIQATPAPTALRKFARVSFLIKVLLVARLPRLPGARLVGTKSGIG